MGKKRKVAQATPGQFPGVTFTSEVIRHVNKQTLNADSSVCVAEAIPTPGYSEVGYSGAFIVGAQLSPDPAHSGFIATTALGYTAQIQVGDRSAVPAMLDPDEVGFFGQWTLVQQLTTSGLNSITYPQPMAISMPVPIIVMPSITIAHKCSADQGDFEDENVFVELFYRTVQLADRAYAGLLLQQQRTS